MMTKIFGVILTIALPPPPTPILVVILLFFLVSSTAQKINMLYFEINSELKIFEKLSGNCNTYLCENTQRKIRLTDILQN